MVLGGSISQLVFKKMAVCIDNFAILFPEIVLFITLSVTLAIMSPVLVLGGTGPAGLCLLRELILAGCEAVVYARDPAKIPDDIASNGYIKVRMNT